MRAEFLLVTGANWTDVTFLIIPTLLTARRITI